MRVPQTALTDIVKKTYPLQECRQALSGIHARFFWLIQAVLPRGDACTDDRDKVGTKPRSTHRMGEENNFGQRLTDSSNRW